MATDLDVTVRKAGPEVIDDLEPLWIRLHTHHQSVMPGWTYHPDADSWAVRRAEYVEWLGIEGSFVLLAERGDELVGYALVHVKQGPDDTWVTGTRMAELESLSVLPTERGKGIGTLLLDEVDAELERLGIGDYFINALAGNKDAIRLYERRGLRPMVVLLGRLAASPKD